MLQNIYSLPDLIDLALTIPEPGFVNFNIIHTVLHTIVKELELSDVRPWCHVENPLLTKTELTKSKLKEAAKKRFVKLEPTESRTHPVQKTDTATSEEVTPGDQPQTYQDTSPQAGETHVSEEQITQTEELESSDEPKVEEVAQEQSPAVNPDPTPTAEKESQTHLDASPPSDESRPEERTISSPSAAKKDFAIQVDVADDTVVKKSLPAPAKEKIKVRDFEESFIFEAPELPEPEPEPSKRPQRAGEAWRYRHLNIRVEATEEGLHRLSNIVDILVDKMKKAELRRKAGFSSEELEVLDERITELEEMMARLLADHELLMEIDKLLRDMLAEFEEIKALAALLKQMQMDISKKADKEETWAALALKGDLELVNTKVDQLEFETAIEELGEAIGLLGIKFTTKNDEWEERAAEMWRAIDGKMSRDIFEAARVKIESRLTALMYALRKIKRVVEDLLYPEASGVTRCILCRRPACISGLECLEIFESPKRGHSDKSSEEEDDPEKLRKTLDEAIVKRQKLEAPPYCVSPDTIISIPYRSSSYRSSIDEKPFTMGTPQMKLMPVSTKIQLPSSKRASKIPKLPEIGEAAKTQKKKPLVAKSKTKSRTQTAELVFTNKLLANFERNKEENALPQKIRYTAVLELEPPKKSKSSTSTRSSVYSSVDMAPDPGDALESFAPARLMPDVSRKDILLSPSSNAEQKTNLNLSPLQFDSQKR